MTTTKAAASDATISQQVRSVIQSRRLSQQQLAAMLGLGEYAVSSRMCGRTQWRAVELARTAEICGVDVGVFFEVPRWAPRDSNPQPTVYRPVTVGNELGMRPQLDLQHHSGRPAAASAALIHDWVAAAAASRAESTVALRAHYVRRLAASHDLATVTGQELAAWVGAHDWRPNTAKSATAALRAFFAWAVRAGVRADDPAAAGLVEHVRIPDSQPRPASDTRFRFAWRAAANDDERLMLLLARGSGLRRAEIAALRTEDLDGDEVWVRGKGDKLRVVPVHPIAAQLIAARPAGWVFPGRFDGHVSVDYVGKHLSRLLGPGWSAHTLRHAYAGSVYEATGDVLALQELLGHGSPETTRRYARPSRSRLLTVGQAAVAAMPAVAAA